MASDDSWHPNSTPDPFSALQKRETCDFVRDGSCGVGLVKQRMCSVEGSHQAPGWREAPSPLQDQDRSVGACRKDLKQRTYSPLGRINADLRVGMG
jgi:hypothetical protein